MTRSGLKIALLGVMFAGASHVEAQVQTRAYVEIKARELALDIVELDQLDVEVATGQMELARNRAKRIIDEAAELGPHSAFEYDTNYLVVSWVGTDEAGKMVVRRLLLQPPAGRPFAFDLPGVGARQSDPKLFEIFFAGDKRSTLVSLYTSTREQNPLEAQVPAFVEAVIGPLFGVISGVAGEMKIMNVARSTENATQPKLFVTASRVILPFRRSSVSVKSLASVPKTSETFQADLGRFRVTLQLDGHTDNRFASRYADLVVERLPKEAAEAVCARADASSPACLIALDKVLTDTLAECTTTSAQGSCVGETPIAADVDALRAVHAKFRAFIKALAPESVEATSSFHNRPPTRLSFGGVTGVVLQGQSNKPRADLEQGKLVADPLGRLLTMAVVNWTPWGYDADSFEPTVGEYVRLFGGAILTPDFGIGGGVSILIVRHVGLNIGGGWIFSKAVAEEELFGSEPVDARKPFDLGTATVFFIGASFNFNVD